MLKKTISVILNTVLVMFLGIAVLVILSKFSIGGLHTYTVLSGSMEPAIHTGSFIFVRPAETYAVGDVVTRTTRDGAVSVTHRIVERIERDGAVFYRTKGDANDGADFEEVPPDVIVGKVMFSIPFLGYAVDSAKKPVGFMILIVIPAVIIIYEELKKIGTEIRKKWDYRRRVAKRTENDNPEEDEKADSTIV